MSLALLCSGQGHQHAGMFALTGAVPEAEPVFTAAAGLLGQDPRRLVKAAGEGMLHANRTAQVLCVTQALAAAALPCLAGRPALMLGYSVGELAAWGVAGAFSVGKTLELAAARAECMDQASPEGDGLAFVRGLSRGRLDALLRDGEVAIAIVNPGDLFVLGGPRAELERIVPAALAAGATRAGPLPVGVASHTSRLLGAVQPFRARLEAAAPQPLRAGRTLLSGLDGRPVFKVAAGLKALAGQVARTIEFAACLEAAAERGVTQALELGPGRALADMAAAALPAVEARALEDFRSPEGLAAWLARAG